MPAVTKNLTIEQKATFRKKMVYRDKFKKPINLTGSGSWMLVLPLHFSERRGQPHHHGAGRLRDRLRIGSQAAADLRHHGRHRARCGGAARLPVCDRRGFATAC